MKRNNKFIGFMEIVGLSVLLYLIKLVCLPFSIIIRLVETIIWLIAPADKEDKFRSNLTRDKVDHYSCCFVFEDENGEQFNVFDSIKHLNDFYKVYYERTKHIKGKLITFYISEVLK